MRRLLISLLGVITIVVGGAPSASAEVAASEYAKNQCVNNSSLAYGVVHDLDGSYVYAKYDRTLAPSQCTGVQVTSNYVGGGWNHVAAYYFGGSNVCSKEYEWNGGNSWTYIRDVRGPVGGGYRKWPALSVNRTYGVTQHSC